MPNLRLPNVIVQSFHPWCVVIDVVGLNFRVDIAVLKEKESKGKVRAQEVKIVRIGPLGQQQDGCEYVFADEVLECLDEQVVNVTILKIH